MITNLTKIVTFRSWIVYLDVLLLRNMLITVFPGRLIEIILTIKLLYDLLKSGASLHAMFILLTVLKVGL